MANGIGNLGSSINFGNDLFQGANLFSNIDSSSFGGNVAGFSKSLDPEMFTKGLFNFGQGAMSSGSGDLFSGLSNFSDMLGSEAFGNIAGLGLGAAKFLESRKALKDERATKEELKDQRREDRAFNKARRERVSRLRF